MNTHKILLSEGTESTEKAAEPDSAASDTAAAATPQQPEKKRGRGRKSTAAAKQAAQEAEATYWQALEWKPNALEFSKMMTLEDLNVLSKVPQLNGIHC